MSYLLDTRSSGCTSFRSSGCPSLRSSVCTSFSSSGCPRSLSELLDSVMYTDELKVRRFTDRLLDPSELLEAVKLVCSDLKESSEYDDCLAYEEHTDLQSLDELCRHFKRYLKRALSKTKCIRSRRILFKVRKLVVLRLSQLISLNLIRDETHFCRGRYR